jgi:hypothetical protein
MKHSAAQLRNRYNSGISLLEVPMAKTKRPRRLIQPTLFDPPQMGPSWESLPAATKDEIISLLVAMLVQNRPPEDVKPGGRRDE